MATAEPLTLAPQAGPQENFLACSADVVFYGGEAGGGKTYGLLLEPCRHIHRPTFAAVVFRRTSPQITNPGGLWDTAMGVYPLLGGVPKETTHTFEFPTGAKVQFAHMQHADDRLSWNGSQVPLIEYDELAHFERLQFFYLLSRNRSATAGIKPYIRATLNPVPPEDEIGGWVHEFVGWYLDENGYADPAKSGVIRWFVNVNDALRWADSREELKAEYPDNEPKSFTFIKASVYDNPALLEADPGYIANLQALPLVEQEQLLGGNWFVRPAAGKVFNKGWFEIVDAVPEGGYTVRFWDLAASEKKLIKRVAGRVDSSDPDFTASCKMRVVGGIYYILDSTEDQIDVALTDRTMLNTALQDGVGVYLRWEMEGGASGKRDNSHIVRMLDGYDARGVRPQGDKITRARALSAQSYAGNVKLLKAPWNARWLTHMHGQPDMAHDDSMDAASGAYNELVRIGRMSGGGSHQG